MTTDVAAHACSAKMTSLILRRTQQLCSLVQTRLPATGLQALYAAASELSFQSLNSNARKYCLQLSSAKMAHT